MSPRVPAPRKPTARLNTTGVPTTINTLMTLEITPLPDVSVAVELEPAVRAIKSPCGNFIWSSSSQLNKVLSDGSEIDVLRIKLVHNDANHDGNLTSKFVMQLYQRDLIPNSDDDQDVMSPLQIGEEIRNLKDLVQRVDILEYYRTELPRLSHKQGSMCPNRLGNKTKFPNALGKTQTKVTKKKSQPRITIKKKRKTTKDKTPSDS